MAFIELKHRRFHCFESQFNDATEHILKISHGSLGCRRIFLFDVFKCKPSLDSNGTMQLKVGHAYQGQSGERRMRLFRPFSQHSDWPYALLPIPMLWNVKMNLNTKIIVVVILSLGILYVLHFPSS